MSAQLLMGVYPHARANDNFQNKRDLAASHGVPRRRGLDRPEFRDALARLPWVATEAVASRWVWLRRALVLLSLNCGFDVVEILKDQLLKDASKCQAHGNGQQLRGKRLRLCLMTHR